MKKLVFFLQILIIAPLAGQELIEIEPMSDRAFDRYYKRLQRYDNDDKLLIESIDRLRDNYITSNHAFIVAQLFESDKVRLDFASLIYHRVSDELNVLEVSDAFNRISYALRFYDYVREQREIELEKFKDALNRTDNIHSDIAKQADEEPDSDVITDTSEEIKFDDKIQEIVYPNASMYEGDKNCVNPLPDNVFNQFMEHLNKVESDSEKVKICLEFAPEQCFTTHQVMKVAESISNIDYRFALVKTFFNFVFDPENFSYTSQLFDDETHTNTLKNM